MTGQERDWLFLNCQEGKHQWESIGGRNAGCELGDACGCSVPVNECKACGDCDYGDNEEAREAIATCRATGIVNLPRPLLGRLIRDFAT